MERASVCYLLHETPGTHGVHVSSTAEQRMRYCTVKSATRTESYTAMSVGLRADKVLKLALACEYDDELQLMFEQKKYNVLRAYETEDGGIELTVQRSDSM